MSKLIDLSGQRFGLLTVIERDGLSANKHATWLCKCDCGNTVVCMSCNLISGKTKSCGCVSRAKIIDRNTKHGLCGSRLYNIWSMIKERCLNPNASAYSRYGARGISICEKWANEFMEFYNWAMDNGYNDTLTIDRINNSRGYCPENCRWATLKQQANNKTNNRLIEYNGETHNIHEWSEVLSIPYKVLYYRLYRGWDVERAMITPYKPK